MPRTVPSRKLALNVYWAGDCGECDHLTHRRLTKAGLYSRSSVCHAMSGPGVGLLRVLGSISSV